MAQVGPKRPPGRPPLDAHDPSVRVTVSMPSKQLDEYAKRAVREDVSIPEIIRRDLDELRSRRQITHHKPLGRLRTSHNVAVVQGLRA